MVNRQGQRFINEDAYQTVVGEAALHGQDGQVYLIVDDAIYERPFPPTEIAAVGETFEELERELGFPEGSLQDTLELYNRHAERGEDPVFHKAAVLPRPTGPAALRGPRLHDRHRDLGRVHHGGPAHDARREPSSPRTAKGIQGLFAAGRTTSGLAAQGYSSGLSLADGTFFGRRAGRAAAARGG